MRIKTELAEIPPAFTVNHEGTDAVIIFYTDAEEVQRDDGTAYVAVSWIINCPWSDALADRIGKSIEQWLSLAQEQSYTEAAASVREKRNKLLQDTDAEMCLDRIGLDVPDGTTFSSWLAFLKGIGSAISGNMAIYRQALRDVTTQAGFPYDVEWPTKPDD